MKIFLELVEEHCPTKKGTKWVPNLETIIEIEKDVNNLEESKKLKAILSESKKYWSRDNKQPQEEKGSIAKKKKKIKTTIVESNNDFTSKNMIEDFDLKEEGEYKYYMLKEQHFNRIKIDLQKK